MYLIESELRSNMDALFGEVEDIDTLWVPWRSNGLTVPAGEGPQDFRGMAHVGYDLTIHQTVWDIAKKHMNIRWMVFHHGVEYPYKSYNIHDQFPYHHYQYLFLGVNHMVMELVMRRSRRPKGMGRMGPKNHNATRAVGFLSSSRYFLHQTWANHDGNM